MRDKSHREGGRENAHFNANLMSIHEDRTNRNAGITHEERASSSTDKVQIPLEKVTWASKVANSHRVKQKHLGI